MVKLSIITICYNESKLEYTCKSIVNQTWQDFEWVVVDGGSNQETIDIFEKYKNRIDKFVSEPDKGIYDAMNKGLKLVSGEYVIFMNAGDSFYNNNVLKDVFGKNNINGDVIYGDTYLCYENNLTLNSIKKYPASINKLYFINNNLNTQSMFVKTGLFKQYGNFDLNYKIVSDFKCWVTFISNKADFKHINTVVANYDMGGISTTDNKLHDKERQKIIYENFSAKEISKAITKLNYTFGELIFSIKNSFNKKYKIITILGVKIKIKVNNKSKTLVAVERERERE